MTIGIDGSRAFVNNRTGTENYSYQLLKALAKVDKRNKYIVYIRSDSVIARSEKVQRTFEAMKQSLLRLPRSPRRPRNDGSSWPVNFKFRVINWPRFWTQGGLAIQTFKDKLDVLFVPAHTLPIIRKPGLKTVVTVHDLGSEYLSSMHQLKQRLYLSLMQKYQLKTATKVIAVSKATKQDLINRIGIEENKISIVYEGFDEDKFSARGGGSFGRKIDAQSDSKSYFLFVGTVQPRKNLERVIAAFSSHLEGVKALPVRQAGHLRGGLVLVIAGSKGWLSDEIYALPKKLGIEERVKFLGYVPEEDLPGLYSGAIALVFPSLFEGFGLPILEAQACGCPVITSSVSSMPEVAGKGAMLVDPYDIEVIVHAMIKVKSKAEREKLVKAGYENVKKFSWEKCAKETIAILEQTTRSDV